MSGKHFRNSKKATLVTAKSMLALFGLVMVVVVYLMLASQVNGIKNDTTFEQIYISRDIALLTDAIKSSPSDITYKYSNKISSRFDYTFGKDNLDLNFEGNVESFPYMAKGAESGTRLLYPQVIVFEKKDGMFSVKNENK